MMITANDVKRLQDFFQAIWTRPIDQIPVEAVLAEFRQAYPDLYGKLLETLHVVSLADVWALLRNTLTVPVDRSVWFMALVRAFYARSEAHARETGLALRRSIQNNP